MGLLADYRARHGLTSWEETVGHLLARSDELTPGARPVNVDVARQVADAVLYEGYLLYPYRASSSKNHARWQFGVLGPPGADGPGTRRGLGDAPRVPRSTRRTGSIPRSSWCTCASCSSSTAGSWTPPVTRCPSSRSATSRG